MNFQGVGKQMVTFARIIRSQKDLLICKEREEMESMVFFYVPYI